MAATALFASIGPKGHGDTGEEVRHTSFSALFSPWEELAVTTDGTQHYQALSALEGEGIPFQEKTQAMGHNTRRAGTVGAAGERPGASVLYYLYVKKADLERARHALGTAGDRKNV